MIGVPQVPNGKSGDRMTVYKLKREKSVEYILEVESEVFGNKL